MYFARSHSSLLSALVWHDKLAFPFGLVAPLALVGLVLAAKGRKGGLIVLFVLSYAGAVVAFFPTARYRLTVIPLLILLACYAGTWIKARLLDRQWRVVLPLGTVLLLLAWSVNAGAVTWQDDAQEHFYSGLAYARKGLEARSTIELHKALQLDPGHYDARFKLAEQYWDLGEIDRAEDHYCRLIEQAPRETAPRRNLGNLYLESGRIEAALVLFREIVELEPEKARSHFGLAGAYRTEGSSSRPRPSTAKPWNWIPNILTLATTWLISMIKGERTSGRNGNTGVCWRASPNAAICTTTWALSFSSAEILRLRLRPLVTVSPSSPAIGVRGGIWPLPTRGRGATTRRSSSTNISSGMGKKSRCTTTWLDSTASWGT